MSGRPQRGPILAATQFLPESSLPQTFGRLTVPGGPVILTPNWHDVGNRGARAVLTAELALPTHWRNET